LTVATRAGGNVAARVATRVATPFSLYVKGIPYINTVVATVATLNAPLMESPDATPPPRGVNVSTFLAVCGEGGGNGGNSGNTPPNLLEKPHLFCCHLCCHSGTGGGNKPPKRGLATACTAKSVFIRSNSYSALVSACKSKTRATCHFLQRLKVTPPSGVQSLITRGLGSTPRAPASLRTVRGRTWRLAPSRSEIPGQAAARAPRAPRPAGGPSLTAAPRGPRGGVVRAAGAFAVDLD